MSGRVSLLFAVSVAALIACSSTAFAQNLTANRTMLTAAFQYAQCGANFTSGYASAAAAESHSLVGLRSYQPGLSYGAAQLSSLAAAGNVTRFGAYLGGSYDRELDAASANISAQIGSAGLNASQTASLRSAYSNLSAEYQTCRLQALENLAHRRIAYFNDSIAEYGGEAGRLSGQGLNANAMDSLLQGASAQIVGQLSASVAQATNASQISAALGQYCLFDGCSGGTNFHLAARFELDRLTSEMDYLSGKNASVGSAQAYLSNASSMLQTVGSAAYEGGQSGVIFSNLTAASRSLQKASRQDSFGKVRAAAAEVVADYQKTVADDRSDIAALAARGIPTAAMNRTLANATSQVILPLQGALNSSSNATQIYGAFTALCLENECPSGTNFHLSARLKLAQAQAELAYLSQEAAAYGNAVTVNPAQLATAQAAVYNASSIIGREGGRQFNGTLSNAIGKYVGGFSVAIRGAYTASGRAASRPPANSTGTAGAVHGNFPKTSGIGANAPANRIIGGNAIPRNGIIGVNSVARNGIVGNKTRTFPYGKNDMIPGPVTTKNVGASATANALTANSVSGEAK
jgi:hypothetical protein